MSETLWITIPINDENALKNVTSLIASKNLPSLSINQLVTKLESGEAADWMDVLTEYNKIPSLLGNTSPTEMLGRSRSVRSMFGGEGTKGTESTPAMKLKDRPFEPRELLSLVILCYSNPTLIGPNLRKALIENNNDNVKKEMIQFSAKDSRRNRVIPSQSNLRLLSTGLYFNDTDIRLPQSVIDRVTRETIRDGRIVIKWDERGGFTEVIDGPARARNAGVQENIHRKKRDVSEIDSHAIWQSLQSDEPSRNSSVPSYVEGASSSASPISYGNQSELTPEILAIKSTNNVASSINNENLAITGLVGLHIFRNLPVVSPVMSNIGKDLKRAGQYVGNLFSRNIESEQQEETTLVPRTARS